MYGQLTILIPMYQYWILYNATFRKTYLNSLLCHLFFSYSIIAKKRSNKPADQPRTSLMVVLIMVDEERSLGICKKINGSWFRARIVVPSVDVDVLLLTAAASVDEGGEVVLLSDSFSSGGVPRQQTCALPHGLPYSSNYVKNISKMYLNFKFNIYYIPLVKKVRLGQSRIWNWLQRH